MHITLRIVTILGLSKWQMGDPAFFCFYSSYTLTQLDELNRLMPMSKRLQVILDERELAQIQAVARRRHMTVAEWVRQALRRAREEEPAVPPLTGLRPSNGPANMIFPPAPLISYWPKSSLATEGRNSSDLYRFQSPHVSDRCSASAQGSCPPPAGRRRSCQ